MEISEFEQKVVKEGDTETDITQHRVFLLGENRWEEPSRLKGNMQPAATKSSSGKATTKCLSCRGEGRLLCMGTFLLSCIFLPLAFYVNFVGILSCFLKPHLKFRSQ